MGCLAPLGTPGRPRRVHHRCQVVDADRSDSLVKLFVGDLDATDDQFVQATLVDHERLAARHLGVGYAALDLLGHLRVLSHGENRPAVGEDPIDLFAGGGLVDRHGHGAHGEDGVIDQQPLQAGGRHDHHPVAGLHLRTDQALGQRAHPGEKFGRGDVDERRAVPDTGDDLVWIDPSTLNNRLEQVGMRGQRGEVAASRLYDPAPARRPCTLWGGRRHRPASLSCIASVLQRGRGRVMFRLDNSTQPTCRTLDGPRWLRHRARRAGNIQHGDPCGPGPWRTIADLVNTHPRCEEPTSI